MNFRSTKSQQKLFIQYKQTISTFYPYIHQSENFVTTTQATLRSPSKYFRATRQPKTPSDFKLFIHKLDPHYSSLPAQIQTPPNTTATNIPKPTKHSTIPLTPTISTLQNKPTLTNNLKQSASSSSSNHTMRRQQLTTSDVR
ncbi:unnamed protein product [Rotaria socialis]|uniref:Uncharacterized protein n=1 Tax=Rotaria socialis TaxID=392032 RepID=A0A821R9B7_9BILA|nr:unnamed protein product [Rotaria socialis]CAF4839696.1 unnamed protein product [Rotaria socialis]